MKQSALKRIAALLMLCFPDAPRWVRILLLAIGTGVALEGGAISIERMSSESVYDEVL